MTDYLYIAEREIEKFKDRSVDEAELSVAVATAAALVSIAQDLNRIADRLDREPVDWRKDV